MTTRAAIDCGSNSTRLLIVDNAGKEVCRELRTTRLGAGVKDGGMLSTDAIERTLRALDEFKTIADRYGVEVLRIAATSAARDASNSGELRARVEGLIGVDLEILSGEQEAAATFVGAAGQRSGSCLVIDIGGRSTELAIGRDSRVANSVSVDVGCVRITEQFFADGGPFSEDVLAKAEAYLFERWPTAKDFECDQVVGTAGTITTLASMELGFDGYVAGAVDGFSLGADSVRRRVRQLLQMSPSELASISGLPSDRADIILGGAVILSTLMSHLSASQLAVSEADILDGLLAPLV